MNASMHAGFLFLSAMLFMVGCSSLDVSRRDCVYHCTFDGGESVSGETSGVNVMCGAGLEYAEGVRGKALRVPAGLIPVKAEFSRGLPIEKGRISYWTKIEDPADAFSGNTYFLSFNGWHMMHRICTNSGAGTSGWQASIGGFHLYGFRGCGSRPYSSLFPKGADPKSWHHYEFVWNTNGIHGAESKIVQYRIDGREILSAPKTEFNRARFVSHMNTCKQMVIGGADKDVSAHPFLIDELEILSTDEVAR